MTQVSAPIRVVALVGLLAALAMGAWVMTAGRSTGESPDSAEPLAPVHEAKVVASKLSSRNMATAAGKPETAAKPKVTAPAKAAAPAKVSATPATAAKAKTPVATKATAASSAKAPAAKKAANGAPTTIAGLLAQHKVVVVLLYDAKAKVDEYSLSEAMLGAKDAGAGFLRVDVRNEKQARHFTTAYGILQAPSLLVFRRPGTLSLKLDGFVDHVTVEQAALSAALPATPAR